MKSLTAKSKPPRQLNSKSQNADQWTSLTIVVEVVMVATPVITKINHGVLAIADLNHDIVVFSQVLCLNCGCVIVCVPLSAFESATCRL